MQSQSQKPSSLITFRKAFPPGILGLMLLQIAIIVGGLIVGAVLLGKLLDTQFDTRPWLTVALFVVASFVAVPVTYRLGMRAIGKIKQAEPPTAPKTKPATEAVAPDEGNDSSATVSPSAGQAPSLSPSPSLSSSKEGAPLA